MNCEEYVRAAGAMTFYKQLKPDNNKAPSIRPIFEQGQNMLCYCRGGAIPRSISVVIGFALSPEGPTTQEVDIGACIASGYRPGGTWLDRYLLEMQGAEQNHVTSLAKGLGPQGC